MRELIYDDHRNWLSGKNFHSPPLSSPSSVDRGPDSSGCGDAGYCSDSPGAMRLSLLLLMYSNARQRWQFLILDVFHVRTALSSSCCPRNLTVCRLLDSPSGSVVSSNWDLTFCCCLAFWGGVLDGGVSSGFTGDGLFQSVGVSMMIITNNRKGFGRCYS